MKTKLFTKNTYLGLLVAFVLMLGVQGAAEALSLTATSSVSQSKRMGFPFEMSLRVGLKSPTTVYDTQSPRRRITDHNSFPDTWPPTMHDSNPTSAVRIDSSGYQIWYIGSTPYRFTSTTDNNLRPKAVEGDTTRVLSLNSSGKEAVNVSPADGRYVDASGNAVDGNGKKIYIRTGASGFYEYDRAKGDPKNAVDPKYRSDYNEEAIGITITRADAATGTLKLKNSSYTFGSIEDRSTTHDLGDGDALSNLKEGNDIGLPSTINLVYEGASVGTHTIKIWDATPQRDFASDNVRSATRPRESITFTLLVTPSTTTIETGDTITAASERIPVQDAVVPVSDSLNFPMEGVNHKNYRIRYEVARGSGTLYVGTFQRQDITPSSTLSVHQASDVYLNTNNSSNEVHVWFSGEDRTAPRATIVFEYRGKPLPIPTAPTTPPATTRTPSLSISVADGETATTRRVTVTATNAQGTTVSGLAITLRSLTSGFTLSDAERSAVSGTAKTITVPTTPGNYTIQASADNYTTASRTITVARIAPGSLTLSSVGTRSGTQQQIRVTTSGRTIPSAGLVVTFHGGAFAQTVTIPSGSTSASKIITLPSATGAHTLYASATGYNNSSTLTIPAPGQGTTPTTGTTTDTTPAPEPDSIEIVGPSTRSGTANTALEAALIVRVLDADDEGIEDARVFFRVRKGQGRLSQRGSGRAIAIQTDSNGHARTEYTPMSANSTVEAEVRGVTRTVTFTITASGGTTTPTPRDTDTDTMPSTINPVVHVGASQRPPMLWVDGGGIYALVGAEVSQRFAPSVENAMNIAVGGGKVYWTEKTGESGGTINSANLNGSGVTELASILAVPMGIAVDAVNSMLYWTNSRGRIQSANLDGSGIKNVMQNLSDPSDIALAGGNAYWTEATGVKFVNLKGQKQVRNISTGMDTPGSLAIAGGKVYWTEKTGESGGTINSANLNGTGAKRLASIQAAPSGIAVDTARSKLYWTNSRGRVQSANLNGSKIQNVVSGLGSPGDMVLSNSITAPTTTPTTTTPTAGKSKYDVNGDGSVDSKDVDAIVVAVAAGLTDAKYDVNGDGKVDIFDVSAVSSNRNGGAASAPALVGNLNLSAVQIDRLQAQIDLLIASEDRSPDAMRILVYLQQLIATARPEKTQLLANYPNPFNPETWIPYELADATQVKITIYNAQGVVIRTLQLGQQSAGYYTDRERAAYWDGRNALGEQVASGIYFYQLETDEMSALRKMVILK